MAKIKKVIILLLAVILIAFMCIGGAVPAFADEASKEESGVEDISAESALDNLVVQFTGYLKDKYGADYEYYYNQIIDNWGSVEAYLIAFVDKLPEEERSDWQKFVGWLTQYAPVWVPAFAIIAVIIIAVVGKVKFKKLKEWFKKLADSLIEKRVNKRLEPIENELNAQSQANIALIESQKALLGGNPKFAEAVTALDEAKKELKNE